MDKQGKVKEYKPKCEDCDAVLYSREEIEEGLCDECIAIQEKFNKSEGKGI